MGIKFVETERVDIPTPKTIVIGGRECGEVKPDISDSTLQWRAHLKIGEPLDVHTFSLFGHGATPNQAVAMCVASGRKQRERFDKALSALEDELGTGRMANEQVLNLK